jgi:hypothetical protein
MTIYVEGDSVRALYVDNEGHVIRYVSPTTGDAGASSAVLVSDPSQQGPAFRLTYVPTAEGAVAGTFEIARPGSTDFKAYLSWRMSRPK